MSRSMWAGAAAIMLLLALTPGSAIAASGTRSASRPTCHSGLSSPKTGVHAVTQAHHVLRPAAADRRAAIPVLSPGTGYRQPAGSRAVDGLQRRLDRLGFGSGPIDGRYGPLTTAAVQRFQGAHRLAVNGIAGPRTLKILRRLSTVLSPGTGYQQPAGSRAVDGLQRRLDRLGFASGPIDGRYGPLTTAAVQRFQGAHRLAVDGIAGPRTLTALISNTRTSSPHHRSRHHTLPARLVIRRHPTPVRLVIAAARRVPETTPDAARPHSQPLPAWPVTTVLLALAAMGWLIAARGYITKRRQTRLSPRRQRSASTGLARRMINTARHQTVGVVVIATPGNMRQALEHAHRYQPAVLVLEFPRRPPRA